MSVNFLKDTIQTRTSTKHVDSFESGVPTRIECDYQGEFRAVIIDKGSKFTVQNLLTPIIDMYLFYVRVKYL